MKNSPVISKTRDEPSQTRQANENDGDLLRDEVADHDFDDIQLDENDVNRLRKDAWWGRRRVSRRRIVSSGWWKNVLARRRQRKLPVITVTQDEPSKAHEEDDEFLRDEVADLDFDDAQLDEDVNRLPKDAWWGRRRVSRRRIVSSGWWRNLLARRRRTKLPVITVTQDEPTQA